MTIKNKNSITNAIDKFIENEYKLSSIQKVLRDIKERDEKLRFIEKYDPSKLKILDGDIEINAFILSEDKKINIFQTDKIDLFIFLINDSHVGKPNEIKCIDFCQNLILEWSNCDYFIIYLNKKATLIKKIIFNGVNTFINLIN